MPVVVPSESASRSGPTELGRFISEAGRTTVYLQSDRGPSVKAWMGAIAKAIPGLRCRRAPTGSPASQGPFERHSQTLFAHTWALRLSLAPKMQEATGSLNAKRPICPLATKLAQWVFNRHMIQRAYQRCCGQQPPPGLVDVGETGVQGARRDWCRQGRLVNRSGVWVGKDPGSREHICYRAWCCQRTKTSKLDSFVHEVKGHRCGFQGCAMGP